MRLLPPPLNVLMDDNEIIEKDSDVDVPLLSEQLLLSRSLVQVAVADQLIFDEDHLAREEERARLIEDLLQRQRDAEEAIRSCNSSAKDQAFLPNLFQKYGRNRHEALPLRVLPPDKIQKILQRKVCAKYRELDLTNHRHDMAMKLRAKRKGQRKDLQTILKDKCYGGVSIYRDKTDTYFLQLALRNTRERTQGVAEQMTFFDMLYDVANKFTRVKDYLSDDAIWFGRLISDIDERLKQQHKDLVYLLGVHSETIRGVKRAEKAFNATDADLIRAERTTNAMLREFEETLRDHKQVCDRTLTDLVQLNTKIDHLEKEHADHLTLPKYPPIPAASTSFRPILNTTGSSQPYSNIHTVYAQMKIMAKATTPEQLLANIQKQTEQAGILAATTKQLEDLLQNVLYPESNMFDDEKQSVRVQSIERRRAIEATLTQTKKVYEERMISSREHVSEQRDNIDAFSSFHETLRGMNLRISYYYNRVKADWKLLRDHGCTECLLELTERNLREVLTQDPLRSVLEKPWSELREAVDGGELLEYRATKQAKANNLIAALPHDDLPSASGPVEPVPGIYRMPYITYEQIKRANEQVMEMARLAEIARLKAADEQAREEEALQRKKDKENRHA